MSDDKKSVIIKLEKGEILILCPCHKEPLARTRPADLDKDGELIIAAGKGRTRWCKEDFEWPEVAAKIFRPEEEKKGA